MDAAPLLADARRLADTVALRKRRIREERARLAEDAARLAALGRKLAALGIRLETKGVGGTHGQGEREA